ncbi:hypothetical protein MMC17_002390 [Xylographa soralifera]|nr:hypothetical protein [Xylographa soralifera]
MAMDGVSSVMAVASLALQLADSVKQLCDFWESVQDAPSRITGLVDDLKIFSATLGELQHDEEIFGPQKVTLLALESCRIKVNALYALLQPAGFSSTSKVMRKWSSVKAVLRRDKIERFRCVLGGAQNTLMSAQLINLRRLSQRQLQYHETNMRRYEYLCGVNEVKKDLSGLRMEQLSEIVTTTTSAPSIAEHLEDIRSEIRKMAANISNPVIKAGCEQGMASGLEQTFSNPFPANSLKKSPKLPIARSASRDQDHTKLKVVLSRETNQLETFFGSISFHTETTKSYTQENSAKKSALSEQYEYKTIFRLFPASWLMNIGLDYSINFTFLSNYQGWHQCLESMRAVPEDSPIFCACGEGDLALVQRLLDTGKASVRDQSPNGVTPLHVAAYFRQPAVCQYLLEHKADPFVLMQTWDNKLLSPAHMACALSYDNFLATYRDKIFGSTTETLAHFLSIDESIEVPQVIEIGQFGALHQEILVKVLSGIEALYIFNTCADWPTKNFNGFIAHCPSINNIIARCISLPPRRSSQYHFYHAETTTSLAMRDPLQFHLWRSHVWDVLHVDRHKFLGQELSEGRLMNDGWTSATLDDLFVQKYSCGEALDTLVYCERCQFPINLGRILEWEEYVDSIKCGTFVLRNGQTHKIYTTTPTVRKTYSRESGTPRFYYPVVGEQKKASLARKAILRKKTKRYIGELQFWNYIPSVYKSPRLYRTRELYDIYAEAGLCPSCAAAEAGEGPADESAEEPEYQAFEDAEEEPPMLAPF